MSYNKNTTAQKKKIFLDALKKNLNVISAACEVSKVSRSTYYRWLEEDPQFAKEIDELPEFQMDFVEAQLLKRIKEGSDTAITFYLRTKGKRRGYNEKMEIEADVNQTIKIIKLNGPEGTSN